MVSSGNALRTESYYLMYLSKNICRSFFNTIGEAKSEKDGLDPLPLVIKPAVSLGTAWINFTIILLKT